MVILDPRLLTAGTTNSSSCLLHLAVKDKNVEIVVVLLELMDDINLQDFKNKTPFSWSVERKFFDIVEVFLITFFINRLFLKKDKM